jgi:hypothetical protein
MLTVLLIMSAILLVNSGTTVGNITVMFLQVYTRLLKILLIALPQYFTLGEQLDKLSPLQRHALNSLLVGVGAGRFGKESGLKHGNLEIWKYGKLANGRLVLPGNCCMTGVLQYGTTILIWKTEDGGRRKTSFYTRRGESPCLERAVFLFIETVINIFNGAASTVPRHLGLVLQSSYFPPSKHLNPFNIHQPRQPTVRASVDSVEPLGLTGFLQRRLKRVTLQNFQAVQN